MYMTGIFEGSLSNWKMAEGFSKPTFSSLSYLSQRPFKDKVLFLDFLIHSESILFYSSCNPA